MSVPSLHACGAVPAVALPSHWRSAASPRVQDVVSQQLGHERRYHGGSDSGTGLANAGDRTHRLDDLCVSALKVQRRNRHGKIAELGLVVAGDARCSLGNRQKVHLAIRATSNVPKVVGQDDSGTWSNAKNVILVGAVIEFAVPDGGSSQFIQVTSLQAEGS